jgi:zinc transport system substrate-binding protein
MSKKSRILIYIIFVVLIFIGFLVFFIIKNQIGTDNNTASENKKLQVATTLFPLYDFAKNIGQDKADVFLILPPGVEPHSFDPKPGDLIFINNADIFIYTGKFMEPWAEDILGSIKNENLLVVDASGGINLISLVAEGQSENTTPIDPHIWLDFDNDKTIVDSIATAFAEKDPKNKSFYEKNAKEYKMKLAELDEKYASSLSYCKSKKIIYAGHYAFGYLAKRYGLEYIAAQGISPDAEPTINDLINLVNQIESSNIKYVFYEELASPKIAEMLSKETGAKLLFLNPAANISKEQLESGATFISIMESNLKNLKIGLEYNKEYNQ